MLLKCQKYPDVQNAAKIPRYPDTQHDSQTAALSSWARRGRAATCIHSMCDPFSPRVISNTRSLIVPKASLPSPCGAESGVGMTNCHWQCTQQGRVATPAVPCRFRTPIWQCKIHLLATQCLDTPKWHCADYRQIARGLPAAMHRIAIPGTAFPGKQMSHSLISAAHLKN
jgi:hypothetical protein